MKVQKVGSKSVYANIVVAVDGSSLSDKAASFAVQIANSLKATLTYLCVVDIASIPSNASAGGAIDLEMLKVYRNEAQKIIDQLLKKYPYQKIKRIVVEGTPAEAILRAARRAKANMIIMGTHGRTGLSHLVSGSVAEHVIRHSTIPVIVIPGPKKKK